MEDDQPKHSFMVFYRDYVNQISISSAEPEALSADRIGPLADMLLQHADNFLGVIDENNLIIQAYLDDDEQSVYVELIQPEQDEIVQQQMPYADALDVLSNLPKQFNASILSNGEADE